MTLFFSQQGEDLLIYRNFINKTVNDGIFLELGACNGIVYSNTLFFEKELGFRGILIEPHKEMYNQLIINRPNNICYNNAVSLVTNDLEFLSSGNGPVSCIKQNAADGFINSWHKNSTIIKVKTITLSNIFKEHNITYIDFFSLDVEGSELDVLQTINWDNISIYLICIELDNHNIEKNKQCRQILIDNGFIFQTKMCINEFWLNPNYYRKHILFNPSKKDVFTRNMNDYGKHVWLEKHCKPSIETSIYNFENKINETI
jgi:FkbM family methyltransferase